jgi:hypothetical protein
LPINKQSHRTNKGEPCSRDAAPGNRCKQIRNTPASAQAFCPFAFCQKSVSIVWSNSRRDLGNAIRTFFVAVANGGKHERR